MRHQVIDLNATSLVAAGARVGRVVRITPRGEILVDFPESQDGPTRARVASDAPLDKPDQSVLLVFENGNVALPIIVGVIRERVDTLELKQDSAKQKLLLESDDELTLVCGKSSITLRGDGRVIVKGAEILSRASGTNKIRGASVKIN